MAAASLAEAALVLAELAEALVAADDALAAEAEALVAADEVLAADDEALALAEAALDDALPPHALSANASDSVIASTAIFAMLFMAFLSLRVFPLKLIRQALQRNMRYLLPEIIGKFKMKPPKDRNT